MVIVAPKQNPHGSEATMTTNYQQLKTMYLQRRYHKLTEWRTFCKWCEELPHFVELTGVSKL